MGNSRKAVGLGFWLASTAAAVLGGAAAQAQTPAAGAAVAESDDIVITAERRTQSLQSVPIAATVLNADLIAKHGIDNIADVQFASPSLAINTFNRSTFINIRGVGLAQSTPTDVPGVATYLDGVLMPHEQMIAQSFYDLNSIEVLRGPQGTLTGQNSTGGAVYITTPAPQFGVYSGYLDQTISNFDGSKTIGALNIPLGDKAAVRIAGVYDQRDSFTTNIGNSKVQPGNVNLFGFRVAATVQPISTLKFNLRYERFLNDTFNNAIKNRNDAVTSDPFTIEEDANGYFKQKGYRTSAEILYDVTSGVRLRWLTSYERAFTRDLSDADRTATAVPGVPTASSGGRVTFANTVFNTLINEVNLISTGDGPVDWVVGAFNQQEEVPVTLARDYSNSVNFTKIPFLAAGANNYAETKAANDSASVFGQIGWQFAPQWKATVGARYSHDKQVYEQQFWNPGSGGSTVGTEKSNALTGRLALNWTPQEDLLYYASIAKGYKAGGVNLNPTFSPSVGNFAPETNYVAELGMKRRLFDRQLTLDADIFAANPKSVQFNSVNAAGNPVVENVGAERSYGAEIELTGRFADARANLGLAYLHAEFDGDACLTNPVPATPAYPSCGLGATQLVTSGSTPPFAPEWTINGGIEYTFHIGQATLTPRLQGSYIDEQLATAFRGPESVVPSHEVFDARVTFTPAAPVEFEAFVTNLADKTYIASQIQNASAGGGIIYGAPRQFGVRMKAKF
jgi:iron complex outermembrane receptor protein